MPPAPLVALLAALLVPAELLPPTREPVQFEAAFQGRCGEGSPCEQFCRELHDGTYECGCGPGYILHVNGYGCLELNATSKSDDLTSDQEEDILYQKDVSFSAELEVVVPSNRINNKAVVTSRVTGTHIDDETIRTRRIETTKLPLNISNETKEKENEISFDGERFKKIDGLKSLMSDGVSKDDINMIDDYDEKIGDDVYKVGEGDDGSKATTLGPSLEQKVPGETAQPPWTAAVESNCNCGPCDSATCSCPASKCVRDHHVSTPRFSGTSWLAFHALRGAYKRVRLRMRVRPERTRGVLLLTGEHDDLSGDYLALILHQGHVELRFDCGSGAGVLRSPEPVRLGRWNTISVYRHRWDAWLKLNEGKKVRGRSKGLFSRMTFREPVWVGGGGNTTGLSSKLGLNDGLLGCVDFLRVNGDTYRLTKDAVASSNIGECAPTLAPWKPYITPTTEVVPQHQANTHSVYDLNDIVHFEDNDLVMRDPEVLKPTVSNELDNSIVQFKNVVDSKPVLNDLKLDGVKEGVDECECLHGGGCVEGKCLCPLGYAGGRCEITLDLKVPRFNGSSYLRLPGLGNSAASWLDIQIDLKPASGTGLVLYNADHANGDGDFFSLHLRDYFVEFAFDLGSGIALVRSAAPLRAGAWQRVRARRSGRTAVLEAGGVGGGVGGGGGGGGGVGGGGGGGARSVRARGAPRRLTLRQPLLLGGAPRPLPPRLALAHSYRGCVGQLIINEEAISVVSAALGGVNVDNCQELGNRRCSVNDSCDESKEIIPEYQTKNDTDSSIHHSIVAKKGFKHQHHKVKNKKLTNHALVERLKKKKKLYVSSKKGKSFQGKQERSNDVVTDAPIYEYNGQTYMQVKYLNANDINWGDTNSYPSFSGKDSFIHMDDEETMKRLLSYTLDINIRFRCVRPHGLLVWSGRTRPRSGDDFLSLGVENSVLVFRYDLGSGEVVIIANHTKVDDGLWHRARATRNRQAGVLEVDGLGSVGKISPGKLKQLNTDNGLYIGGLPSIEINTMEKYTSGLVGCVSQISLSGDFDIPLSLSKLPHTITNNVGRCVP